MALLEFSNLSYGFGEALVIDGASGALHPGNVIGLVGVNGGGKTTLLRLLTGELQPQAARVQRQKGLQLGYVGQKVEGEEDKQLFAYVRSGRDDLLALERKIADLSEFLAGESTLLSGGGRHRPSTFKASEASPPKADVGRPEEYADNTETGPKVTGDDTRTTALHKLGEAQAQYASLGGHRWESEVERLLYGLAFTREQFVQPLGSLSGGQRQKAALARALLSGSQCLIFDEPTNHLDIDAQAFFADYVKALAATKSEDSAMAGGQRGVLLVSHDRWLLDRLCTHIWELEDGALHRYSGGYSKSAQQREERRKQAQFAYQRQQEQIARTEEYIRRNIAGQNTRQAQGRRTLLTRMERLEKPGSDPQMSFVLKPAVPTGEQVLVVEDLSFSYVGASGSSPAFEERGPTGDLPVAPTNVKAGTFGLDLNPPLDYNRGTSVANGTPLIDDLTFTLLRAERMAIVGPNGSGKTTLLKLLTRQLSPQRGLIAWGSNVELGIFSQDSADLSSGRNLLAELRDVEPALSDGEARSYLARFGFSGDDVMKDVGALSGGERSRLSLAKIFRRRPNVLVLDEPTNHLDIYAREALEQFLAAYEGMIVMVTHDRALLERLCQRLVVFEREDSASGADSPLRHSSVFFRGDYQQYVKWREAQLDDVGATGRSPAVRAPQQVSGDLRVAPTDGLPTLDELTTLARQQRMSLEGYCRKQAERERRRAAEVEARIEQAEARSAELLAAQRAADEAGSYAEVARLQDALDAAELEIEQSFEELHVIELRAEQWEQLIDAAINAG